MPPGRRTRDDNFETVHVWPKTAEREQFITQEYHPNGVVSGYATYGVNDAVATEPPQESRSRSKSFGLAWWTIEILAMLLSIVSMIAIVIVLRVYDGRAVLELKLPAGLTLNAIIAALATVSRAALIVPVAATLMQELWLFFASESTKTTCSSRLSDLDAYDSASRGLVGSLKLLVRPRGRRIVASLAALIMVLSLAFGTFTQQAVAYGGRVNLSSGSSLAPGNIARSETWNQSIGIPSEGWISPPFDFIAAFYSGALTGDASPPPVSCLSGNCTWPSTPSLAVCGGCVPTQPVKTKCFVKDENGYFCNYTMPSGSKLEMWDFDAYQSPEAGVGFQVVPGTGAHFNASKLDRAYFSNFDLMGAPYMSVNGNASNKAFKSAECALWQCVQTYNTSVDEGQIHETVIGQIDDVDLNGLMIISQSLKELSNVTFPPVPASVDPQQKTEFFVDAIGLFAMRWYFEVEDTMRGNVTLGDLSATPSSDLMYGIWNGTIDLDTWINNVARSVTNVLRATNRVSDAQYNGTAQGTGVNVRWLWLLLPLILVALSLIVLIITIIRTGISPVNAWKGSPLTFLLFRVDERIQGAAYGHGMQYHGFRKAVGEKEVRLVEDGGTFWKFKPC